MQRPWRMKMMMYRLTASLPAGCWSVGNCLGLEVCPADAAGVVPHPRAAHRARRCLTCSALEYGVRTGCQGPSVLVKWYGKWAR